MPSYKEILLKNKLKPEISFQTENYLSKYVEPVLESKASFPEYLQTYSDWRKTIEHCRSTFFDHKYLRSKHSESNSSSSYTFSFLVPQLLQMQRQKLQQLEENLNLQPQPQLKQPQHLRKQVEYMEEVLVV